MGKSLSSSDLLSALARDNPAAHKVAMILLDTTPPPKACTPKASRDTAASPKPKDRSQSLFISACKAYGVLAPTPEHRFHPTRKWRLDYAWPSHKVALEVEGGIWTQGRHTRGAGALGDMEKYNALAAAGWRLLRRTPSNLMAVETFNLIRETLEFHK